MIYKVFYQETKDRNPRRETTHALYLDIDAPNEREGRIQAISVPDPMAIPTSAIERAGASLIPSPTKATLLLSCSFWMALAFS